MGETTCWTMIEGAARGHPPDREAFVVRYAGVIRAYLSVRWARSRFAPEVDDAVQDVFLECFRAGGALSRLAAPRESFRAFLLTTTKNVARRFEARRQGRRADAGDGALGDSPADDDRPSQAFDRAWVRTLLQEATERQTERAVALGSGAQRRVELLRLRFGDELEIREIARLWSVDAAALHHEYARARIEYREALRQVMAFHHPQGGSFDLDAECDELLSILDRAP